MSHQRTTFQTLSLTLLPLAACIILPPAASAAVCPVDVDSPAILSVDAPSKIFLDAKSLRDAVVLERSNNHLIVAVSTPTVLIFDTPACDLRVTLDAIDIHEHRILRSNGQTAISAISFMPQSINKEEDHEFDPDPLKPMDIVLKEEDHEFDPDPLNASDFVLKEEDHEFDPDPLTSHPADARALVTLIEVYTEEAAAATGTHWADAWTAASEVITQFGPGWYFLVRDGAVTQEILIETEG